MIKDQSGLSSVGLALLRNNLAKLTPAKGVELKRQGNKQVLVVEGPEETYESSSFGWGQRDNRTQALSEALGLVGLPTSTKELAKADPSVSYRLR